MSLAYKHCGTVPENLDGLVVRYIDPKCLNGLVVRYTDPENITGPVERYTDPENLNGPVVQIRKILMDQWYTEPENLMGLLPNTEIQKTLMGQG